MTSDSDLSTQGKAKRLMYAWGSASVEPLREAIKTTPGLEGHVAIHYTDLVESVDRAVQQFISDTEKDDELRKRVLEAAQKHYAIVPVK